MAMILLQDAFAQGGGGRNVGSAPEAVINAEKPTPLKIGFGVGMLIAGILAVKYL